MESWIRQAILAAAPNDGSRIGNQSLIQQVQKAAQAAGHHIREESIQAVRAQLIAEGVLGKGGGRGGSVYRIDATDTPPASQSDNANEAPTTESASSSGNDQYGTYRHGAQATLRPDVGVQDQFSFSKKPRQYRYDSSLAPELIWDENAERDFAEWLLNLIAAAAQQGEAEVFGEEQRWLGTHERFTSIGQCVVRLKSLTRPFLNWAGKAERQRISIPTVPLFIHERHATRAILERLQSYKLAGEQFDLFGDPQLDIAGKTVFDQRGKKRHRSFTRRSPNL